MSRDYDYLESAVHIYSAINRRFQQFSRQFFNFILFASFFEAEVANVEDGEGADKEDVEQEVEERKNFSRARRTENEQETELNFILRLSWYNRTSY
jgi:hypothetical protein